ncbi:SCO family protein [Pontibacter liquoris]|uniref:SCO family protein n=1 Tax=Pontibacter liquoris TaxID=2905677 RepID=UPI001FA77392|nr:SCO family protein [Pontibacter liquoris]
MKRFTYPLLLALAIGFAACQPQEHSCCVKPTAAADHNHNAAVTTVANTSGALTDMSLYNLTSDWTNQNNQKMKLEKLRGKAQLVAMIYTSCGYACPRTVADLKSIEQELGKYKIGDVGIVLVSMDPDRDTPAKLKAFAKANQLDTRTWTLLTSQPDDIQELAALLNVKYSKDLNGNFSHSNIITVLNAQGEIVHQQEGLGTAPTQTVKVIQGLAKAI